VKRERGYVLVTVLAFIVLALLIAAELDARVTARRAQTAVWQDWGEARGAMLGARDRLLNLMLVRQISPWGFGLGPGALRADGRVYRTPEGLRVSVQDERGLISVNTPDEGILRAFLVTQGVAADEVDGWVDTLADYTDPDSLHRLNGAEAEEYRAVGRPPPANDWMMSAFELGKVLKWDRARAFLARPSDFFTANREPWINIDTAPPEVLRALPGFSDGTVAAIMARRQSGPIETRTELAALSAFVMREDEPFWLWPGLMYRVRVWCPDRFAALEYHVMMTPGGQRTPYRIIEARAVPRPAAEVQPAALLSWEPPADVAPSSDQPASPPAQ
jgi:general secretion pathway protein K